MSSATTSVTTVSALPIMTGAPSLELLSSVAVLNSAQRNEMLWPIRNARIGLKTHQFGRLMLCTVHKTNLQNDDVLQMSFQEHVEAAFRGASSTNLTPAVRELLRAREMRYAILVPSGHVVATQHDWISNGTVLDFQMFNYNNQTHKRNMALRVFGPTREECAGVFTALSTWVNHESADLQLREQLDTGHITQATVDRIRISDYTQHSVALRKEAGVKFTGRSYAPFVREVVPKRLATGAIDATAIVELTAVTEQTKTDIEAGKTALRRQMGPKKRSNPSVSGQRRKRAKAPTALLPTLMPALAAPKPANYTPIYKSDVYGDEPLGDDETFKEFSLLDNDSALNAVRNLQQIGAADLPVSTVDADNWLAEAMVGAAKLSLETPKAKGAIPCTLYNSSFFSCESLSAKIRSEVVTAPSSTPLQYLHQNQPSRFFDNQSRYSQLVIQHSLVSSTTAALLAQADRTEAKKYAAEVDLLIKRMIEERGHMPMTPVANVEQFTVAASQFGYTAEQIAAHLKAITK